MLRKILIATDFSESAGAALEYACGLARSANAELLVLHALELPVLPMGELPYFTVNIYDELERYQRQQLTKLVAAVCAKDIRSRGVFHVGRAAVTIVECAGSEKPELIVIGTHGRRGLSRMFLGSVAERVVRSSSVPVLTVRASTLEGVAREPRTA